MNEQSSEIFDSMILDGSIEVAGLAPDSKGFIYNFASDLEERNPELFSTVSEYFYKLILSLWEKGFLDISVLEDDIDISVTDLSRNEEAVKQLSDFEQSALASVLDSMSFMGSE